MSRTAILAADGRVLGVYEADIDDLPLPPDTTAQSLPDEVDLSTAYRWDGTAFVFDPLALPDDQQTLDDLIATRRAEVDALLAQKLASGGVFNGVAFELDDRSVLRLNSALAIAESAVALGQNWPGVQWTAADNTLVTIPDLATLRSMVATLGGQGAALYAQWQAHKAALLSSATITDLQSYDITVGW